MVYKKGPGAQLVKAWICNLRIAGSSLIAGGVFFWYGPLASLPLQIASVSSDRHGKKMEAPTRGLGSKSLHVCKRSISPGEMQGHGRVWTRDLLRVKQTWWPLHQTTWLSESHNQLKRWTKWVCYSECKNRSWQGSNLRDSACKANVITTTPHDLSVMKVCLKLALEKSPFIASGSEPYTYQIVSAATWVGGSAFSLVECTGNMVIWWPTKSVRSSHIVGNDNDRLKPSGIYTRNQTADGVITQMSSCFLCFK